MNDSMADYDQLPGAFYAPFWTTAFDNGNQPSMEQTGPVSSQTLGLGIGALALDP